MRFRYDVIVDFDEDDVTNDDFSEESSKDSVHDAVKDAIHTDSGVPTGFITVNVEVA